MHGYILITGATGFLGSHLTHAVLEKGYTPVILKRKTSDISRIKDILKKIKIYDTDNLEMVFSDQHITAVFHTACCYGRKNESLETVIQSNLVFGIKVLEKAICYNTDTFFNTDTLLQKYLNKYSLSKKQFVEWLKMKSDKIQIVNLKLEHMYGVGDDSSKFVKWILNQILNNENEVKLTEGKQKRDFIYVSDVVAAYLLTLEKRKKLPSFSEFDVGTGNLISIRDFVENLYEQAVKIHPEISTKLLFGAVPYREGEQMEVKENVVPLKQLGWNPVVMYKDGIKELLNQE